MSESVAIRKFGPNWVAVSSVLAITLIGFAVSRDIDPSRATIPLWAVSTAKVAIVATPFLLLLWLLSVRLTIDQGGIQYRSLFNAREMRWDEVDELYAGAARTLLYGIIPLGTRYSFRLKTGTAMEQRVQNVRSFGRIQFTSSNVKKGTAARVLSFGTRFSGAEKINTALTEFTFPHIWRRASQQYKDSLDVNFGDFVLNRQGMKVGLLGLFPELTNKPIPWKDVLSYRVENGMFFLVYGASTEMAKTYTAKREIAQIPNFMVMMKLLHELKPSPAA